MKLHELFEAKSDYTINNDNGRLSAKWKKDLIDEEDDDYLPKEYDHSKILELQIIEAKSLGKGQGEALMKDFLNSPIAKQAELIFLDISPNIGKFEGLPEKDVMDKLYRFYKKFGFESAYPCARMWKVQKCSIKKSDLPT